MSGLYTDPKTLPNAWLMGMAQYLHVKFMFGFKKNGH